MRTFARTQKICTVMFSKGECQHHFWRKNKNTTTKKPKQTNKKKKKENVHPRKKKKKKSPKCVIPKDLAGNAEEVAVSTVCHFKTNNAVTTPATASSALWLRRPPRKRKIPGSNPACAGIFPGSSRTSGLKIDTPVATLTGAWCYRVSAGTGLSGVSIMWLGEMESWICNFYLSVAASKIVWADPSLRYTRVLLGR